MKKILQAFVFILATHLLTGQTPRMVLFEEFTGENCGPCAQSNPYINSLMQANQTKVAAIKWQVPIPSAPGTSWSLYQTNKTEIDWRWKSTYYGISAAPQGKFDGQNLTVFGCVSNHPGNLSNTHINNAQAITSPFSISMLRAWSSDGSAITLTISVTASANFAATGNLIFRTVMIERVIQFSVSPGSNGETHFEDVAIRSFPSIQAGTPLPGSWTLGQTETFTLNCPIPTYCRKKTEIGFVGFVQDDGNKQVKQAFRLEKQKLPTDAVASVPKLEPVCASSMETDVTVMNDGLNAITNLTITPYIDGTAGNVTQWTGNIASGATATITLDPLASPATSGAHTFSYNITGVNDTDMEPANNGGATTFLVANDYQANPVVEGFDGTFPPQGWTPIDPDNKGGWIKNSTVGGYGQSTESMMISLYTNNTPGQVEEIVLPPVDLTGTEAPALDFLYAYARRSGTSSDKLQILASNDCGETWTSVFSRTGALLSSMLGDPTFTAFIPQAHQWRSESIQLANFNSNSVLIKFAVTSGNGNNLYIDDVNLRQISTGVKEYNLNGYRTALFPNPSAGNANLEVWAPVSGEAELVIMNSLGQKLSAGQVNLVAGMNNVPIDLENKSAGIYHVMLKTSQGTITQKLTLTN